MPYGVLYGMLLYTLCRSAVRCLPYDDPAAAGESAQQRRLRRPPVRLRLRQQAPAAGAAAAVRGGQRGGGGDARRRAAGTGPLGRSCSADAVLVPAGATCAEVTSPNQKWQGTSAP